VGVVNADERYTVAYLTLTQALDRARAKASEPEVIRLLDVAADAVDDLEIAVTDQILEQLGVLS
jgi:hypothetical protein